jgi:VWFA-related protein
MLLPRAGIWLAALTIGVFTIAQEQPTFKVDVEVVNVLATVRDRDRHIISNLTQDDFILEENGKKQEIRYFSRQTDLPLTIGLLVDTSQSQRNLIEEERSASYQFFKQVMRPDRDNAFVTKFDIAVELLQKPTNSLSSLQKTLNDLNPPSMRRPTNPGGRGTQQGNSLTQIRPQGRQMPGGQRFPGSGRGSGQPNRISGVGTLLYDAVFLASNEILRKKEGRKAIILISDGVDAGSKLSEKDAIEAAHRADTIIYCIRYYDPSIYSRRGGIINPEGSRGKAALKTLAKETGGRLFEPADKIQLRDAYDSIQEELRNQYNLGYVPPKNGGSEFRRIKLLTKKGKFEIVTRAGYYPKK